MRRKLPTRDVGQRVNGDLYQYRDYNRRTFCRVGSGACTGGRIPTIELDATVMEYLANIVCTVERGEELARTTGRHGKTRTAGRRSSPPAAPSARTTFSFSSAESIVWENEITVVSRPEFAVTKTTTRRCEAARFSHYRGYLAPADGLEPPTRWLTATCSTD